MVRKKIFSTKPTRARLNKNLLYRHDKPNEPTKDRPLSFQSAGATLLYSLWFCLYSSIMRSGPYVVSHVQCTLLYNPMCVPLIIHDFVKVRNMCVMTLRVFTEYAINSVYISAGWMNWLAGILQMTFAMKLTRPTTVCWYAVQCLLLRGGGGGGGSAGDKC